MTTTPDDELYCGHCGRQVGQHWDRESDLTINVVYCTCDPCPYDPPRVDDDYDSEPHVACSSCIHTMGLESAARSEHAAYLAAAERIRELEDEVCELQLRVLAMETVGDNMATTSRTAFEIYGFPSCRDFYTDWEMAKDAKS